MELVDLIFLKLNCFYRIVGWLPPCKMETILSQPIEECGAKAKMLEIPCSKTPVTKKIVIYSEEMNVRTSISIYSVQEINLAQIVSQVNLIKESAKPFIQFG